MSLNGVFITGTDTGVGKTHVGAALCQTLKNRGDDVQPRKPVESGCHRGPEGLVPADGLEYHRAVQASVSLGTITPYRLAHAISPERAARLEGQPLTLDMLEAAVRAEAIVDSRLVVEGAGGFYSPLTSDGLNADLAARLGVPVLVVAPDRLGVLNHVLLTLQAIERRGLSAAGVVLSAIESDTPAGIDNAADLTERLDVPVIAWGRDATDAAPIADRLFG